MLTPQSSHTRKTLQEAVQLKKVEKSELCVACYAAIYPPSGSTCFFLKLALHVNFTKLSLSVDTFFSTALL